MICESGHAFDFAPGNRCPVCGGKVNPDIPDSVQRLWITRADLAKIREGLRAANILAECAVKVWPEAVEAQDMIREAIARADRIRDRYRWGRKKTEHTCGHSPDRNLGCTRPGTPDGKEPK